MYFVALILASTPIQESPELLYRQGERAMMHHDYVTAQERFRKLYRTRHEPQIAVRLANSEQAIGNLREAQKILSQLNMEELDSNLRLEAQLLLARLCNRLGEPDRAVLLLCDLDRVISRKKWKREDRAFFTGLLICVSDRYRTLLQKAEECLENGLYGQATPLYQEVLEAVVEGQLPLGGSKQGIVSDLRFRLAEVAYQQGDYNDTIQWLLPLSQVLTDTQQLTPSSEAYQPLYLLGLAQFKCGKYKESLESFAVILQNCRRQSSLHEETLWHAGLAYFMEGELEKAKAHFSQLQTSDLGELYLARIDLKLGDAEKAEERLLALTRELVPDSQLQFEVAYLRGEAALHRGEGERAVAHFAAAIPKRHPELCEWHPHALFGLGKAHLSLQNYSQAEAMFKTLLDESGDERAVLGLARTDLARGAKAQARARIVAHSFTGVEEQAEALLLLAAAESSYSTRQKIYSNLLRPLYSETSAYGAGYLAWGLDQLHHNREEAIETLGIAFDALRESRPERAAFALKSKAQAHLKQGNNALALSTLDRLIHSPCFDALKEKDEVHYLRGLAGQREAFNQVIVDYPDGSYAPIAMHALATLYLQEGQPMVAETLFVRLASAYPSSSLAGDAWYWAAQTADAQEKKEEAKLYRQRSYESYPEAPHAAECYFSLFAFADYLQGQAQDHLRKLPERFPSSPYAMVAHYLLGLHDKDPEHFAKAIAYTPPEDPYFQTVHTRALVELARLTGDRDALERALQESPELEEGQFLLAKLLIRDGELERAEQMLTRLSRQESYYESLAWQELGRIAIEREQLGDALRCFSQVKQQILPTDERLELSILESHCLREQGDLTGAMLLLSKVINDAAISPRRMEAMYLRAEVYALQGRHELAIKQLEACAKGGGEWAKQAETTLQEEYGFF